MEKSETMQGDVNFQGWPTKLRHPWRAFIEKQIMITIKIQS